VLTAVIDATDNQGRRTQRAIKGFIHPKLPWNLRQ